MKEDESIEQMYSRFQTLVSGLQILKKSYVASDHVSKILRSLPARWRPKVTAIEEAKYLNTLSVEDLVSSLKVHEIGLNEHEPAKKVKSIALPFRGKSSKALKQSEDESPDGDSDENPTEKMAMLSNKLEYLARKNMKFLSKKGGYKSSKKEDQKGCFNCKKTGHFIAECPDLQKDVSATIADSGAADSGTTSEAPASEVPWICSSISFASFTASSSTVSAISLTSASFCT